MKSLKITLPLPPSVNRTYKTTRSGGFYKSSNARAWEEEAGWEIKRHCRASYDPTDRLYFGVTFFFNRDRDISNCMKILEDIFQKMNIIPDDKQIYHENIKKEFDKKYPRVEVEIERII